MPALAAREAAREERRRERTKESGGKTNEDRDGEAEDGEAEDDETGLPPLPCIVAVDLQPMAPVEGIFQIQGDITSAATAAAVISAMSRGAGGGGGEGGGGEQGDGKSGGENHDAGNNNNNSGTKPSSPPSPPSSPSSPASSSQQRAQLVVCDGAPDVTGLHDMDEFMQSQLVVAALTVATELLEDGGTLVAKVFRGREAPALLAQLEPFFRGRPLGRSSSYGGGVFLAKPRASRNASVEAFVVCRGYGAPRGLVPRLLGGEGLWPALAGAARVGAAGAGAEGAAGSEDGGLPSSSSSSSPSPPARKLIPFVACGDLRGWDADMSYDLPAAPVGARGRRGRGRKDGKKKKEKEGGGEDGGGGEGGGDDESEEEEEAEETFYVPLPPTALPTAPAYALALALSGRPAAGMKGAGA